MSKKHIQNMKIIFPPYALKPMIERSITVAGSRGVSENGTQLFLRVAFLQNRNYS